MSEADSLIVSSGTPGGPEPVATPGSSENPVIAAPAPASTETPASVPWDDFKKLRDENADYRKRFQPFEQTFGGLDPDERESWLTLAQLANSNDPGARAHLATMLNFIDAEEAEASGEEADPIPAGVTRDELLQILSERDAQTAQAQAMEGIFAKAEDMGYKRNTKGMYDLLYHMNNSMDVPDIKAADKLIKDEKQATINEFLDRKRADAGTTPVSPSNGTAANQKEAPPRTFAEARRRATARFESERG